MNLVKIDRIVPSYIKYSHKFLILKEELHILKKSILGINLGYHQVDSHNGLYISIVISLETEVGSIIIYAFKYINGGDVPKMTQDHIDLLEKYKQQYFENEIKDLITF